MQTQSVQESREGFHDQQDANGGTQPGSVQDDNTQTVGSETQGGETHVPEDGGEFRVSQRQSPQTQVGSGVGHRSQHEFNGFNDLMYKNITKVEFFIIVIAATVTAVAVTLSLFFIIIVSNRRIRVLVAGAQDQGLGDQHEGNANEGNDEQDTLRETLASVQRCHIIGDGEGGKEHVDHHRQQQGRFGRQAFVAAVFGTQRLFVSVKTIIFVPGIAPLDEDEEDDEEDWLR